MFIYPADINTLALALLNFGKGNGMAFLHCLYLLSWGYAVKVNMSSYIHVLSLSLDLDLFTSFRLPILSARSDQPLSPDATRV